MQLVVTIYEETPEKAIDVIRALRDDHDAIARVERQLIRALRPACRDVGHDRLARQVDDFHEAVCVSHPQFVGTLPSPLVIVVSIANGDDAVARGTPILVTQASPMSRPILARLGFRELCEIRILLDEFDQTAESSA